MNLKKYFHADFDSPPVLQKVFTYFVFAYLVLSEAVIQVLRKAVVKPSKRLLRDSEKLEPYSRTHYHSVEDNMELLGNIHEISRNFKPASTGFEELYNVGALSRMKSCFHREIRSRPNDIVQLSDGVKINFCSYNYLGFAGENFISSLMKAVADNGFGAAPRSKEQAELIDALEKRVAEYIGKPAAFVHAMGFDTNALVIPIICKPGSLIISDSLNHSSIVQGCRRSKCTIMPFKHNVSELMQILESVDYTQYTETWVFVEGLYSMEGSYLEIRDIIKLKAVYNFKLYVDEAHSIGCTGTHGKGICEKFDIDPAEIEVLMGTFTKSFSSVGGYIAASEELVELIRNSNDLYAVAEPLEPICAEEVISCIDYLETTKGIEKLRELHYNSTFLRTSLKKLGFTVYGDDDSPVIPVLFYCPTKMKFIEDYLLKKNIVVVEVGFPAVPLVSGRIRFCVSAAHTEEEIKYLVECMSELGDLMRLKFEK